MIDNKLILPSRQGLVELQILIPKIIIKMEGNNLEENQGENNPIKDGCAYILLVLAIGIVLFFLMFIVWLVSFISGN